MKKLIINVFFMSQMVFSREVGRHDGGEYFSWISRYQNAATLDGVKQDVDDSYELETYKDYSIVDSMVSQPCSMNFKLLRDFFPIFKLLVHNYPIIYLDSASTAQMPQMVLDAIVEYYTAYKANVGRGLYVFAERSTQIFEETRAKVARFIGAEKQEIVFTSGATAGINLVSHVWAQHYINKDDEIIVSEVEHNANFIPWQQLAQRKGIVLKIVPVNEFGVIDVDVLKTYLTEKTKLVAINHQSNILGTINDIAEIVEVSHAVGAKVLVDAAQSIAHQKIDVRQMQCDFLVFSGHKLFGPTGVGVLFIQQNLFDQCVLHNFGGGMVYSVTSEHVKFKGMPHCLEPGTQAIAQVIGLGAAIDFISQNINFNEAQQHETMLVCKLAHALEQIPGIRIISVIPSEGQHNNMVTFVSDSYHAYDIAEYLDQYGIAVRSGFHCAQPYHDKLGVKASVRISFSFYNTEEEVEFLIHCLKKLFEVSSNNNI